MFMILSSLIDRKNRGKMAEHFGESPRWAEVRAGWVWVGEAPDGCLWLDACWISAWRPRGYAHLSEGLFLKRQTGNPHQPYPPNAVFARLAQQSFLVLCLLLPAY